MHFSRCYDGNLEHIGEYHSRKIKSKEFYATNKMLHFDIKRILHENKKYFKLKKWLTFDYNGDKITLGN